MDRSSPASRPPVPLAGLMGIAVAAALLLATVNLAVSGLSVDRHVHLPVALWIWLIGTAVTGLTVASWLLSHAPRRWQPAYYWWVAGVAAGLAGGGFLALHGYLAWLQHWR
jgi:hypothetical protein